MSTGAIMPAHWDTALCVSSSLGWLVAGVVLVFPSLYYAVLHVLAIAGFFAIATSATARQVGAELSHVAMLRASAIIDSVKHHPYVPKPPASNPSDPPSSAPIIPT